MIIIDINKSCDFVGFSHKEMETIEIGAVKTCDEEWVIDNQFSEFIKPLKHPQLSFYCRNTTKIDQETIDQAPFFSECWRKFMTWAEINDATRIVTWSSAPLKQLQQDCSIHHLNYPKKNTVISLKKLISKRYNNNSIGFNSTLELLKVNTAQRDLHRPVDRAICLFEVYKLLT